MSLHSTQPSFNLKSSRLYFRELEESKLRNSLRISLINASKEHSMWSLLSIQTLRSSAESLKMPMAKPVSPSCSCIHLPFTCHVTQVNSNKFFKTTQKPLTSITQEIRRKLPNFSIPRNSPKYSLMWLSLTPKSGKLLNQLSL